jgi:hypothetical protein
VTVALCFAIVQLIDNFLSLSVPLIRIIDLSDGTEFEPESLAVISNIMFYGTCFRILFEFCVSLAILKFTHVIGVKSLVSLKKRAHLISDNHSVSSPKSYKFSVNTDRVKSLMKGGGNYNLKKSSSINDYADDDDNEYKITGEFLTTE